VPALSHPDLSGARTPRFGSATNWYEQLRNYRQAEDSSAGQNQEVGNLNICTNANNAASRCIETRWGLGLKSTDGVDKEICSEAASDLHRRLEPSAMAQCSTCGSTVPESAAVCPDCGMELKSASAPAMEASKLERQSQGDAPPVAAPTAATAPPSPKTPESTSGARLTLRRGGALSEEVFSLGRGPSIIGRFDPETGPVDVDLGPLPEAVYISRHHAEIWCDGSGQWFVKDLGSGNATFVCAAGERQFRKTAGEHPIKNGDEIALGNARFEFRVGG